ncbi:uncharacterized protein C8R40DRAFT_1081591 [Lentinula edodes]|uniref:uncharacterized protein n=1 Tax=Lentinula edodes TaxID=5353 RepID=UPI001E8C9D6B|nr:uncharacterized protein C8R40DRAFT_1081591 [Lentinula edodes]KAH7880730.1 hypothetical protein C8R40DRAFT_1081591 [Lentinula edodes]
MEIVRIDIGTISSLHLDERGEPKIGGSVGGFIALVVCLILVIIIACTATFFLLRLERFEEAIASRHRRRLQHQTTQPSSYIYQPSSTPSKSWLASLKGVFSGGLDSIRHSAGRRMKGRDGWIQAGLGDEWDDDMQDVERLRSIKLGDRQYMTHSRPLDPPFHPPPGYLSDSSLPNRFASESEESEFSIPNVPPVDISAIPRSASPKAMAIPYSPSSVYFKPENKRKSSTNSEISTRTFNSGTRFVEGL